MNPSRLCACVPRAYDSTVIGFLLTAVGLMVLLDSVWWWQADRFARQMPKPHRWRWGVSLFMLAQIIGLLSILLGRYLFFDARDWMPMWLMIVLFMWHLLVLPATIILVISSFTCQLGVNAIRRDDRAGFIRNIGVTLLLGIIFLGIQAYDYMVLGQEGLTLSAGPYGTTYYTLTGFHGAHVFGGVIMLAVVLYRGMAGQFSARHHDAVEATSIYWHFVDVVWIGLYLTLYWLR